MAGLSVLRLAQQTFITKEQWDEIFDYLKSPNEKIWVATAGQVADWWRERERVSFKLEPDASAPVLNVTINGSGPLKQAVAVYVNLPEPGQKMRLVLRTGPENAVRIAPIDAWRSALILKDMTPGTYWQLFFDRP